MLVGSVSTGSANDLLGVAAALTGLVLGVARYWTTLSGGSKKAVERATARGFFTGLTFGAAVALYLGFA